MSVSANLEQAAAVQSTASERLNLRQFWWRHARVPLVAFVLLAGVFAATSIDRLIAHALFFDSIDMRWIGAQSWWLNQFLHTGGRWFIRAIVAAALALLIATWLRHDLRWVRRPAAYFVLATVLSIGIVGLLKVTTNVHCPWDLAEFGGKFAFVELFAHRPQGVHPGQCFPAAHASSGYALLALYFVFRERNALLARLGLALGIAGGLIFGIAQQARGAHFVSHDLWSVFLVWMISLTIYTFVFKTRLWDRN
jgi:membrane-associated PAP2 superfamily phosphatase